MESPIEKTPPSPAKVESARRNADSYFVTWEKRTMLVKAQVAAESASRDAKTARLRALRLAKEAAEKDAAPVPEKTPPRAPRKRVPGIKA